MNVEAFSERRERNQRHLNLFFDLVPHERLPRFNVRQATLLPYLRQRLRSYSRSGCPRLSHGTRFSLSHFTEGGDSARNKSHESSVSSYCNVTMQAESPAFVISQQIAHRLFVPALPLVASLLSKDHVKLSIGTRRQFAHIWEIVKACFSAKPAATHLSGVGDAHPSILSVLFSAGDQTVPEL